ncbi:hypothetical protein P280DRAFT_482946 [Massarina eburnea CBS 473.64]|uniref:Uncharacterized protein n=1 Tax=Massarina eburnea CBS 473.64 TaxID=1395130 RepID=A0A6A6RQ65_9PLEO|nr:hypothetical protein P280DRAFT_482946 [Massarina eburnea CBS 473.64]
MCPHHCTCCHMPLMPPPPPPPPPALHLDPPPLPPRPLPRYPSLTQSIPCAGAHCTIHLSIHHEQNSAFKKGVGCYSLGGLLCPIHETELRHAVKSMWTGWRSGNPWVGFTPISDEAWADYAAEVNEREKVEKLEWEEQEKTRDRDRTRDRKREEEFAVMNHPRNRSWQDWEIGRRSGKKMKWFRRMWQ